MPTVFTIADVERIAELAHLDLTHEEKQLFSRQLADILTYAEQVHAIDTSGVPATAHVHAGQATERNDEPRPSLAVDDALANAPDGTIDDTRESSDGRPAGGLFRVPRVIGG